MKGQHTFPRNACTYGVMRAILEVDSHYIIPRTKTDSRRTRATNTRQLQTNLRAQAFGERKSTALIRHIFSMNSVERSSYQ